ncbi:MAG: porin [Candidatus Jettenia sp.]|uniref:Phosphate-selective porin O and P n=1 Tax=Candidatus Jettenia caeni TaxID=247490 RepID=I3IHJ3_9BACT|nr:porin [Candidatus Jettenia sp. AMX1]MBC6930514.1 porin [Candidatus Jettenia sp.]NUN23219.1 porin [Candidatus Jettenia caeni]KAA0246968.1 MAG: porin [Candidatus Jettenia sp. AMX1]MCE7882130.1 porin [Candidatus Jettenia sp. AMX1]MCQ3928647.1 porin [Candidatus Jettenia sp.]
MRWKWYTGVLSSAMVLWSTYAVNMPQGTFAQETEQAEEISGSERDYLQWQLKQMEESMQRQQEQIQALKNRMETVSPAPAPITKEEIKHEIEDYMSTTEAREKMALGMPGLTPVYTPDDEKYALSIKSREGDYTLNAGGRLQFRYTFKDRDEDFGKNDTNNIDVRRARVYFGGNIYSKLIHYYVELDGDSFNVDIRDFYVYFTPFEELNAKIGYFKVPFNRQRVSSSSKLLLQDRSIASEFFDQDRDYGFDIYGKPFDGHVEYHAAVFNGAGEDPAERGTDDNIDNELMYVLGVRYNPFGKYDYYDETDVKYSEKVKATIGAAVVFNPKLQDEKLEATDGVAGVVDLGVKYKGISWNNEYYMMSQDPEDNDGSIDSDGFFTQVGYFVLPKRLEVAARYSQLDPNDDVSNDTGREYALGINYYFRAHRSKIQSDFSHYVTEGEDQDQQENRFRIQYQIIF